MTKRFKETVQYAVLDGVLTLEEKTLLKTVAKEENVSDTDAEVYILKELKKRKVKISRGDNWIIRNSGTILSGIISLGGIVLTSILNGKKK